MPSQAVTSIGDFFPEHRSFAERQSPPRALIELARRCGLLAAVEAHDAGMSTPVLAVRQETHL